LCDSVAQIVLDTLNEKQKTFPVALCFGGTHYPDKFTKEILQGIHALGTVIPKHTLEYLDEKLFSHIMQRNDMVKTALLEWSSLGQYKQKVLDLISTTSLEVIKL